MTEHILMIEDDESLAALIAEYLGTMGFKVSTRGTAAEGLALLPAEPFDALILDVMLPDSDGFEVCRQVRARSDLPILMLTARGDETDRIVGLELGADDYLPKPFNPRELVARIQAVLRRRGANVPGAPTTEDKTITFSDVEVDLATRTLKRNAEILPLTTGEFAVLKVLLEHPRQPLSRDRLMALARGREQGPFDRAIDVQISRLRKLIEPDPSSPRYLQTVWGFGYVFVPDGQAK